MRLIPYVDLDIIRRNPKVFMGYSDTTITHFMCMNAGLGSFYGPSVLSGFAENVALHYYTIQGIKRTLFSNDVMGDIPTNNEGWTSQMLPWEDPANQHIKRTLNPPTQRQFFGNTSTAVRGRLIGGCLETFAFLNGTSLWPSLDTWKDTILFFETSEEGMSPFGVTRCLRNLAAQGILHNVNGLLFRGTCIRAKKFGISL